MQKPKLRFWSDGALQRIFQFLFSPCLSLSLSVYVALRFAGSLYYLLGGELNWILPLECKQLNSKCVRFTMCKVYFVKHSTISVVSIPQSVLIFHLFIYLSLLLFWVAHYMYETMYTNTIPDYIPIRIYVVYVSKWWWNGTWNSYVLVHCTDRYAQRTHIRVWMARMLWEWEWVVYLCITCTSARIAGSYFSCLIYEVDIPLIVNFGRKFTKINAGKWKWQKLFNVKLFVFLSFCLFPTVPSVHTVHTTTTTTTTTVAKRMICVYALMHNELCGF